MTGKRFEKRPLFLRVSKAAALAINCYRDAVRAIAPPPDETCWIDPITRQHCFGPAEFVDAFVHEVQKRLFNGWLRRFGDVDVPCLLRDVDTHHNRRQFFALQRDKLPSCSEDALVVKVGVSG